MLDRLNPNPNQYHKSCRRVIYSHPQRKRVNVGGENKDVHRSHSERVSSEIK
jgi:hypothetical protein